MDSVRRSFFVFVFFCFTVGAAELRVVEDASQQLPKYEFILPFGVTSIGRRSDNVISLPVLSVSKKHANFDCQPSGAFYVTDLGSSNKTRLFASKGVTSPVILRPNTPYQVFSGCEILFGEIRCTFTALSGGGGGGDDGMTESGYGGMGESGFGNSELYYDEVGGDEEGEVSKNQRTQCEA